MVKLISVITICLLCEGCFAQGRIIRAEAGSFALDIYLPPNYHAQGNYKTIYFNDGEMIFNGMGMALDKKLDQLIEKKIIEPLVVVAIYSKGNRLSWYVPYEDDWIRRNWGDYKPLANTYTQNIIKDIIPYIEKNYSVEKLSSARAIAGSSLGGLHATWAGLKFPGSFSYSIALSPSYWVAEKSIFKEAGKKLKGSRFWFDLGTGEWEYYVPFYQQLQRLGYTAGEECFYYEIKDGQHTPTDWSSRIEYPLLVFAGFNKDLRAVKMEVEAECIPSQAVAGRIYRRVNAVITLANGIRYTLSNTARYILKAGDIKLQEDGTISAGSEAFAEMDVLYKNFNSHIRFSVADCQ